MHYSEMQVSISFETSCILNFLSLLSCADSALDGTGLALLCLIRL